jgi:Short C-terminal domain
MSIADELRKLGELHRSGALTDEEFATAKARVLADQGQDAPADSQQEALREQLGELKRENELARLDREWQLERERYQMTGRYGARYMPTKASGIVMGVVTAGFGVVWTVMAAGIGGGLDGPGSIMPLFGVLFVLVGIGVGAYTFLRATQLEQAQQRYQRRRALIISGDDPPANEPRRERGRAPSSTGIQDITEPAPCLSCGKTIPPGQERCPHCGWSYT